MNTIFDYSAEGIEQLVLSLGQPKFRAKQLIQWIYQRGAVSFDEMTNLPATLRATLAETAPLIVPELVERLESRDGTRKYLLRLADGNLVETVGIPSRDSNAAGDAARRLTVCFSTQVGCPMACSFCATGKQGLTRNLNPGEMVQQLLVCQRDFGLRVSNAVAMGQGEPFLNYDNLMAALHFMNTPDGMGIGARRITVSTCGITSGIHAFAREPEQFTLALSLHCAIQEVRDKLMPVCAATPLSRLREELDYYQEKSGRRISFEYLMISGLTDTDKALDALISFTRGLSAHVNLLKINHVDGSPYEPSSPERLQAFLERLQRSGIETTVRDSRGEDIDGACGQLYSAVQAARS